MTPDCCWWENWEPEKWFDWGIEISVGHELRSLAPGPVLFSRGLWLSVCRHADLGLLKKTIIEGKKRWHNKSQNLQFSYSLLFFMALGPAQQYVNTNMPVTIKENDWWLSVSSHGKSNGKLTRPHPTFTLSVCVHMCSCLCDWRVILSALTPE